jgi:hypothetical protein
MTLIMRIITDFFLGFSNYRLAAVIEAYSFR